MHNARNYDFNQVVYLSSRTLTHTARSVSILVSNANTAACTWATRMLLHANVPPASERRTPAEQNLSHTADSH